MITDFINYCDKGDLKSAQELYEKNIQDVNDYNDLLIYFDNKMYVFY